jgi:hypothetical protein
VDGAARAMETLEEPISPELALVDPELRRRSLACLPDQPWIAFVQPAAPRDAAPVPGSPPKPRRLASRLAVAAVCVAAVIAALIAVELTRPAPTVEEVPPAAPAVPASAQTAAVPRASHPVRGVEGRGRQREFAWAPVPGAASYRFALARGATQILSARTPEARIDIPPFWRFRGRDYRLRPGTYRWAVRPAFRAQGRIRYGKPVVSSRLTVTG